MIIREADADTEASALPGAQLVSAMTRYDEEMVNAGVVLPGDGLEPSAKGARISFSCGEPVVTDGPFAEAKELVAGLTIVRVGPREEALERVKRWLASAVDGEVEPELRDRYEADGSGEEFAPEIRRVEEGLRARRTERR
jgi:hypothetical protein